MKKLFISANERRDALLNLQEVDLRAQLDDGYRPFLEKNLEGTLSPSQFFIDHIDLDEWRELKTPDKLKAIIDNVKAGGASLTDSVMAFLNQEQFQDVVSSLEATKLAGAVFEKLNENAPEVVDTYLSEGSLIPSMEFSEFHGVYTNLKDSFIDAINRGVISGNELDESLSSSHFYSPFKDVYEFGGKSDINGFIELADAHNATQTKEFFYSGKIHTLREMLSPLSEGTLSSSIDLSTDALQTGQLLGDTELTDRARSALNTRIFNTLQEKLPFLEDEKISNLSTALTPIVEELSNYKISDMASNDNSQNQMVDLAQPILNDFVNNNLHQEQMKALTQRVNETSGFLSDFEKESLQSSLSQITYSPESLKFPAQAFNEQYQALKADVQGMIDTPDYYPYRDAGNDYARTMPITPKMS